VSEGPRSPLEALGALASQEVEVTDGLRHVEVYTLGGLLTLLWHGDPAHERVVLACGGAMGGLLGPAEGLYHDLGVRFAEQGIGLVRIGYRKPNDLDACVHDLVAVAELAARRGGRRFVTMGHSFGGAVAVRAAIVLGDDAAGVVTLATQSAGCEGAERLGATPVLLYHGVRDELLPPQASELVQMLTGGELVVFPGTGHLLTEVRDELRDRLATWIPARFA
jgi:predicted esterase